MRFHDPRITAVPGSALLAFTLLLLVGIVHGWLAFGCYLVNEHRRLVWYEIVLMWTGDVLALFWYAQYCVRWYSGRRGIETIELPRTRLPRSAWLMLLSLGLGMIAELSLTLMLRHDEFQAFGRRVPAVCQVTAIHVQRHQGAATYWKLDGRYTDAAGQQHPVTFYVRDRDEMPRLPWPVAQAVRQKQVPIALPVVYDPIRPSRSWIPQMGWDDNNRLHYLSLVVLMFQFLFTMLFFFLLRESIRLHLGVPWWADLHKVLPLACEAFIIALFGGIELYLVRRLCP